MSPQQPQPSFMKLQPLEIQWIYDLYKSGVKSSLTPQENTSAIASALNTQFHFSEAVSAKVASKIVAAFSSPDFSLLFIETVVEAALRGEYEQSAVPAVRITTYDYNAYLSRIHSDPSMTPELAALLLALVSVYRHTYHPSGWIRYEKKIVFHLAGLSKLPVSQQEVLTRYLHSYHGLNMQVVGSNQPIPCFALGWLESQPLPGSEENPYITLGPLLPETIRTVVSGQKFSQ